MAVTLYYLSDEGRMSKTANAFGLSRSTVSVVIRRVTRAITIHLGPQYQDQDYIQVQLSLQKVHIYVKCRFDPDFTYILYPCESGLTNLLRILSFCKGPRYAAAPPPLFSLSLKDIGQVLVQRPRVLFRKPVHSKSGLARPTVDTLSWVSALHCGHW